MKSRLAMTCGCVLFALAPLFPVHAETASKCAAQAGQFPGRDLNSNVLKSAPSSQYRILARKLADMRAKDQEVRRHLDPNDKATITAVLDADNGNTKELKRIIGQHGLLGLSQVGSEGVAAIFLVIQHSHDAAFQQQMLGEMRKLMQEREMPGDYVGMLEDRLRVDQGKPQVYGTQVQGDWKPFPIEDPAHLDERRASVGLVPFAVQQCFYDEAKAQMGSFPVGKAGQ